MIKKLDITALCTFSTEINVKCFIYNGTLPKIKLQSTIIIVEITQK